MCKECHFEICPPSCPNFSGEVVGRGKPRAICSVCKGEIYSGEAVFEGKNTIICTDCAYYMDLDEIAEICTEGDIDAIFENCGFEKRYL